MWEGRSAAATANLGAWDEQSPERSPPPTLKTVRRERWAVALMWEGRSAAATVQLGAWDEQSPHGVRLPH